MISHWPLYRWVPFRLDFWEHENLSGLFTLNYTKKKEKEKKFRQEIWAKWESGLTVVWLKQDPPVIHKLGKDKVHSTALPNTYFLDDDSILYWSV